MSVSDTDGVSSSFVLDEEGKVHVTWARLVRCVTLGKIDGNTGRTRLGKGRVPGEAGVRDIYRSKPTVGPRRLWSL